MASALGTSLAELCYSSRDDVESNAALVLRKSEQQTRGSQVARDGLLLVTTTSCPWNDKLT